MAGTTLGRIEAFNAGSGQTATQRGNEVFKTTYDFFKRLEAAGYINEYARNDGDNGTFGNPIGTDYYDDANPFGENAWVVWEYPASTARAVPFYVYVQWTDGSANGAPATPSKFDNSTSGGQGDIAMQVATAWNATTYVAVDPWNGTTGSLGSDTKGTPVWDVGAGEVLHVLPNSNAPGGASDINKEDCAVTYDSTSADRHFYMWGDEDHFTCLATPSGGGLITDIVTFGTYVPIPGMPPVPCPVFLASRDVGGFVDVVGNDAPYPGSGTVGGVVGPMGSALPLSFFYMKTFTDDPNYHPNQNYTVASVDLVPVFAAVSDFGLLGPVESNWLTVSKRIVNSETSTAGDWLFFKATASTNYDGIIMIWDGITLVGSGATREGIDF